MRRRLLERDVLEDVELEQSKPHLRRQQLGRDVLEDVVLGQQSKLHLRQLQLEHDVPEDVVLERKKLAGQKQHQNLQNRPRTRNLPEAVVQERRMKLRCEKQRRRVHGILVDVEQQLEQRHGMRVQQRS